VCRFTGLQKALRGYAEEPSKGLEDWQDIPKGLAQ
jgi:hypothetical protein